MLNPFLLFLSRFYCYIIYSCFPLYRSGLVCDDDFSESAAKVVCRQIGYPTTNPKFQTDGKFKPLPNGMDYILDDVRCTGNEASLSDCTHSTWFKHDCSGPETVAVTCDGNLVICASIESLSAVWPSGLIMVGLRLILLHGPFFLFKHLKSN